MTPERYKKLKRMLSYRQPDLTVLMENVHKAHNLAAIARTCDAVGIPGIHAITTLEKLTLRSGAASGSGRWVPVKIHENIEEAYGYLRREGYRLLTAHFSKAAVDFRAIDYTQPTAVVVGQELDGISAEAVEQADDSIIIPMYGMVQSLNVSVATAIVLYEAQRQRFEAGLYTKPRYEPGTIDRLIFEMGYPRLAAEYRSKGLPYPRLDENGRIKG